jgi:glycerophosphoryl diester phosphodiesterase
MTILKVLSAVVIALVMAYNAAVMYVDAHLDEKDHSAVYSSCHKIWAARGLYETRAQQNTVEAMERAFGLGAHGAEVDFHYDIEMDRFIISHDHPKQNSEGKLLYTKKEGVLFTLEAFLKAVGKDHYFWLDYKNLDKLTVEQTHKAIARLLAITDFNDIRERLYIEGSNPLRLSMYTDAGFKTILGIHPLPNNNIFASIVLNGFKIAYYFKNITALAMPFGKDINNPVYGELAATRLKGIPMFVFHVLVDDALIKKLVDQEDVRVLLVGKDLSINRYAIDACKE